MKIKFSELHLKIGQEIGTSEWLEITQERIDKFAEATGDYQWIHCDVERANREIGGTIAHGYLVISLLPVLFNQCLTIEGMTRIVNFGSDRVRLKNPVKAGSRVRLIQVCDSVKNSAGGKIVKIKNTMEIEGEKRPALVAETLQILYSELEEASSTTS